MRKILILTILAVFASIPGGAQSELADAGLSLAPSPAEDTALPFEVEGCTSAIITLDSGGGGGEGGGPCVGTTWVCWSCGRGDICCGCA